MPEYSLTQIEKQLKSCLGRATIEQRGRQSGFERRAARVITTAEFVASLLSSLGTRRVESLADLHRDFNADHGTTVNYKPYYERLDSVGFVKLMHSLFEALLRGLYLDVLAPARDSVLKDFDDVIIHDGSSFALHDDLSHEFSGRFTTVSPSAVELHATMSLKHDNLIGLAVTSDSECERHYTPEPAELRNKLFLADRGYDSTAFMREISEAGGYFCVRARSCLDPIVIKIHRRGRRYRELEGQRLSQVVAKISKAKCYDIDVVWPHRSGGTDSPLRLLLKYQNKKNGWMRVMTNLERTEVTSHEILRVYRLRWQIELYFKELKSYANLHAFSTCKAHIAEGLIWASLCVAFLKRYLAHGCQLTVRKHAISTRRASMCGHLILRPLFRALGCGLQRLRPALREIFDLLARAARRSNPKRERQRGRLALALCPVGVSP